MELTNTLAYYDMVIINAAKSFIIYNPLVFIFIASIQVNLLEKEAATVGVVLSKNENVKIKHFWGEKY